MEECSSLRSSDSAGTSEEYEIVESLAVHTSEPQLNIANDGNMEDLKQELREVMREKGSESSSPNSMDSCTKSCTKKEEDASCFSLPMLETQVSHISTLSEDACGSQDGRMDDRNLGENNPSFSQMASDDDMERIQTEDGSGDYTIFNRVTYLGAASINAPRSEAEIQRNMAILNAQAQEQALEVSVSVPSNSEGYVIIYDATTSTEMTRFKIHRILFCARGKVETSEARCFAFTSSHGDTQETAIFQCHVFRCQIPEAVARVLITFAAAFRRVPRSKLVKKEEELCQSRQLADYVHLFDISLEIKEEDSKGNFNTVPRDKEFFKLRSNTEMQLVLTVTAAPPSTQSSSGTSNMDELCVERCFGLLVAPGRRVKHADMNVLEMQQKKEESSRAQMCEEV